MAHGVRGRETRVLALASVLALAGAGGAVTALFACSAALAVKPAVPHIDRRNAAIPEHTSPLPDPSPREWARWWRSGRRPADVYRTMVLNGRPIELIFEALPPGWQYPCTDAEMETALRGLPAAWTARLRSMRLTFHPEWDAQARTDRSRIEISYIVDPTLRAPGEISEDEPEELRFGARLETENGARCLAWPDRETLRVYILRHILIHELGHHVAPEGMEPDKEEEWAETFAYRYYTPHAAKRAASR